MISRVNERRVSARLDVVFGALSDPIRRTIVARLYGTTPVELRWDPGAAASTGALTIPDGLPAGRYVVRVTAEDLAHNMASQEVPIDVLP